MGEIKMHRNVGETDQVVRLMAGTLLLTLAATDQVGTWGWVAGLLTLLSGTVGICAAYSLLGLNTCPNEGKDGSISKS
jgi:hypothetical protein